MPSAEERLRRLEDEREILRTLYTYGYAIDYGLEEEFMDCWTDDATLHWPAPHPAYVGRSRIRAAFALHTHAPDAIHKHVLVEPLIRIEGEHAQVTSLFLRLDVYPEGPQITSFGRYRDVLVRSADGRWRFQERRTDREATRVGRPRSRPAVE